MQATTGEILLLKIPKVFTFHDTQVHFLKPPKFALL